MAIARAKIVRLYTGGWGCIIAVENSKMSSKKLRSILEEYGGEERESFYWFDTNSQYWKVIDVLSQNGAYVC